MPLSAISQLSQDNHRFVFEQVDDRIYGVGNNRARPTAAGGIEPGSLDYKSNTLLPELT